MQKYANENTRADVMLCQNAPENEQPANCAEYNYATPKNIPGLILGKQISKFIHSGQQKRRK